MKKLPHIIVVAGPTASGKSDFAVELAKKHNGEIISADSRQVYSGLDIGTGKITQEEMKGVTHHMLDVVTVGSPFSVAEYARLTTPIIHSLLAQGKTPIICGGTGQYIDALIYTPSFPPVPPNEALRKDLEEKSAEELHRMLSKKDPVRAKNIDTHNKVRLIRALEIVETLGKVPTQKSAELLYDIELYLMNPTREQLRERITQRLEKRLQKKEKSAMFEETRALRARAFSDKKISSFGIEYTCINSFLNNEYSYEEMKKRIITKSMQYAKRQQTWNKKYESFAQKIEVKE